MAIIYRANDEAFEKGWDWDEIFKRGAIKTVAEFDTVEEALEEYESSGYDPDIYGVF